MKAEIGIKDSRGRYKVIRKKFKDQKHLDNYLSMMDRNGNKVVGHEIKN